MSWLDLHLHSNSSLDGQYTPEEIMALCSQSGVKVAALSDHNSTAGVARAKAHAEQLGITLIEAIELDCFFQGTSLHILGYWIDPTYPDFRKIEEDILLQEQNAAKKRIHLVQQLGIKVDERAAFSLSNRGAVTGEAIGEVALSMPENKGNSLLLPYREGGERSDNAFVNFYWDFCAPGKPANVPIAFMQLKEAVDLIHAAGGIAVLAHPGNNIHEKEELLVAIAAQGVIGIEAYSSYHTAAQTQFYVEKAQKLGLFCTVGSDFHGKIKPMISCGGVDCFDREAQLLEQMEKNRR